MPVTLERLKRLQELGLTEYQSRTYLALLDVGEATASQLPSLSQVPRTRIYTTMTQLHEKGLVETKPETPIKYKAIPFETFLEREIKKLKRDATELEAKKDDLSKEFAIHAEEAPPRPGRFRVFYGRRNMMEQVERMYSSAKREVLHLGTGNTAGRLTKLLMGAGRGLKKKGVGVKMVLPVTVGNREDIGSLQEFAEVRHTERSSVMPIVVVDSAQALIADLMKDDKNISLGDSIALWTNDEMIVRGLGEVVRDIWEAGVDIEHFTPEKMGAYDIMKWLLSVEMKTHSFVDKMVEQIGSELSKDFKAGDIEGVFGEIAEYWTANGLGKVRVDSKTPPRVVVESSMDYADVPNMGNPVCRMTEGVIKRVIDERLEVSSKVVEEECRSLGDSRCSFRVEVDGKVARKGRSSAKHLQK